MIVFEIISAAGEAPEQTAYGAYSISKKKIINFFVLFAGDAARTCALFSEARKQGKRAFLTRRNGFSGGVVPPQKRL
ncbi:MAG: hypothetical protein ACOX60_08255 [Massiliimalia sp.]